MSSDYAAIERLCSWDGIGIAIERRIIEFENVVRANAPFRPDHAGVHLVDTIGHTKETNAAALVSHVGCNPVEGEIAAAAVPLEPGASGRGYALMVHEGTRPHQIRPRPPRKSLRFTVAGRVVYATRVAHPGNRADPFLTRWIREIVR